VGDQYIGEIRMFGGNFAPRDWALCNGQLLNISEYEPLFMLLGTTYGGDGQTTFALPNLCGRIPVHMGTNQRTGTNYQIGAQAGAETVTLTSTQMPAHTHAVQAITDDGNVPGPANALWAKSNLNQFATPTKGGVGTGMAANAVSAQGGSQPHDNMMPSLCVNFIIALNGIFPSQS
jgi:microcystin-dependent protein